MPTVSVTHEWGELKEVILGRPLDETDRICDWQPGMDEEFSFLKGETFDWLKGNAGKPWKEADPDLFAKINDQVANYVATERAEFALSSKLNVNLYNRDSLVVLGDTLVETSFRSRS